MADLSKLILPVKDATTGEISNQEFDLTGGGGGAGDMQKSVYDSTDAVADAGGIPSYVSNQISDGTLTIQKNGTAVATFSANQSTNATANIVVPEYSSLPASSGGTDTSLVTTGEKYTWDNKSKVTIGNTGTASSTVVSYQRVGINGSYTAIKGTMYMLISNTSSTSYVFTNSNITSNSSIDVYTDTYGDNPSSVSVSGNTCTVTFSAAKTRSVKIYIK